MSFRISVIMRRDHLPEERHDVGKYIIDAGLGGEKAQIIERQGEVIVRGGWASGDIDFRIIFFVRALRANPVVGMVFLEID